MPRTEGGGQDWVHPLFSKNLPAAYLNPRAVTRNLADKVSKGHTMGLAGREKHCLRHFLSPSKGSLLHCQGHQLE